MKRRLLILISLSLLLVGCLVLSVGIGSVSISANRVLGIVYQPLANLLGGTPVEATPESVIIWNLRLPRSILAAAVGAALSVAGVMMQGLLRNPLADPYVLGVSAGASVGAAVAMLLLGGSALGASIWLTPLFAFLGATLAVLLVYLIANTGQGVPVVTLLLSGIALNTVLSAVLSFLIYFSQRQLQALLYWLMGSFSGRSWPQIAAVLPYLVIGTGVAIYLARDLNAFSLGEDAAATLGVSVLRSKQLLLVGATLLTAGAVSVSGIIGFVGLVVPHVVRILFGPDHRLLVPTSALAGAVFLVVADLLARTLLPNTELPVGIITSLAGGPFFLYLLRRKAVRD